MYIWKIDKLNNDLIAGDLPEKEIFKYFFTYSVLASLAIVEYSNPNNFDTWFGIISGLISILGLIYIYKCNGGETGKDFLIRYLSIGLVVLVRMSTQVIIPSLILFIAIQEIYLGGLPAQTSLRDLAFWVSMEIVYLFWVAKHVTTVAKESRA